MLPQLLFTLALLVSTTLGQLNNDQTGGDIEEEIVPQNKPQTRGDSTEDKGDESEKGEEDDHHENTPDHNDHEGEEDNDGNKGKKGPKSNWNLGISLPWLPTARFNLSSIPKSSLVSTGFPHDKDVFICRVLSPCRRMKIMGKLNYKSQTCTVPCTASMSTIKARKLVFLETDQQWHHYEVLTNPERLNLFWALVDLRQSKKPSAKDHLMAPRPVLAGHLGDPSVPPPFVARAEVDDVSFVGVVQETNDNGTTAFYYGLYNVVDLNSIRVLNVMNTQPPSKEEQEDGEVIDGMTPKRRPRKPNSKPKPKPKPKPNKKE